jgi:hypothetical protein
LASQLGAGIPFDGLDHRPQHLPEQHCDVRAKGLQDLTGEPGSLPGGMPNVVFPFLSGDVMSSKAGRDPSA